ncbi:hypothetical protein A3A35_02335 [Candidatus Kaiserbacteria bacterium RIFCSPLOWO2_01_FULL_51_21]|uniref:Uncharacterized protein n=1 Tax=Candidatus Kaiserbacteria bacterium RIFCSPLOWO2_01_FULL_51_21 TaxID=1798508 RepID=A0A1F6EFQ0_9BACT|nr:MAG: hypothetical protein A3A35_02335 [Candidatus Kaiserbacteria bacterium RIFCSPLOWO2_01_FULL_51_21]
MPSRVTLKLTPHKVLRDTEILEIFVNGVFCATLTPDHEQGAVRLISAHIENSSTKEGLPSGVTFNDGRGSPIPVPFLSVRFRPRPYRIKEGELVPETVQ